MIIGNALVGAHKTGQKKGYISVHRNLKSVDTNQLPSLYRTLYGGRTLGAVLGTLTCFMIIGYEREWCQELIAIGVVAQRDYRERTFRV